MGNDRLELLVSAWFDGALSARERIELESCLLEAPQARAVFWEIAQTHALLRTVGESGPVEKGLDARGDAAKSPVVTDRSDEPFPERKRVRRGRYNGVPERRRYLRQAIAAAAALLAVGIGFGILKRPPVQAPSRPVSAGWSPSANRPPVTVIAGEGVRGFDLPKELPGVIRLPNGEAKVRLPSGVELALCGPLELEVKDGDGMEARLTQGGLVAWVPQRASGFTVHAPGLTAWDIGTVFSIATLGEVTDVFVFKGKVQVGAAAGAGIGLCEAGQGVRRRAGGGEVKTEAEGDEARELFASVAGTRAFENPLAALRTAGRLGDRCEARPEPATVKPAPPPPVPGPRRTVQGTRKKEETESAGLPERHVSSVGGHSFSSPASSAADILQTTAKTNSLPPIKQEAKMKTNALAAVAAAAVLGTTGTAQAATWKTGTHVPANWTISPSNLLVSATRSGGVAALSDGVMAINTSNGNIANNTVVTWTLSTAASISDINVYSAYKDGGRDGISISKIEILDEGSGEWSDLGAPAVEYGTYNVDGNNSSAKYLYAFYSDDGGAALAHTVSAVRLTFGIQDNNMTGYGEIEILGYYPEAQAVLKAVTVSNEVFTVHWLVELASTGAGDGADVNLWTSADNVSFSLVDTALATDANVPVTLSQIYDTLGTNVYYRIELVNTDGTTVWKTTNNVATVTTFDNATYYWKSGSNGMWESAANWNNSYNDDPRLTYPNVSTATASFEHCDEGGPVTVELGASKRVILKPLPDSASVTFKGASSTTLALVGGYSVSGTNIYDGLKSNYESGLYTAAKSMYRFINGASAVHNGDFLLYGVDSRVEVASGSTFPLDRGGFCGNAHIIVDDATVTVVSTFTKSPLYTKPAVGGITNGTVVLKGAAPLFGDSNGHYLLSSGMVTPFTIRFEFPAEGWAVAPYRFGNGHGDSRDGFGGGNPWWRVEVPEPSDVMTRYASREIPLVESLVAGLSMFTNNIEFAVFGVEGVTPGKRINSRGDHLYYTYNNSTSPIPATEGDRPTGLWFHFSGRETGTVLFLE